MSNLSYNLKGIARMILPRAFAQKQSIGKIAGYFRDFTSQDLELIANRINHCCKLNKPFNLTPPNLLASQANTPKPRLSLQTPTFAFVGQNNLSSKHSSAYYYDSYQYTRYFADNLIWAYCFGDVNYYLDTPAISKTRPIDSVLDSKDSKVNSSAKSLNAESLNGGGQSAKNLAQIVFYCSLIKTGIFAFLKTKSHIKTKSIS